MSVIVKHAIDFPTAKFHVTNDLLYKPLEEGYLIDVDVTVEMHMGVEGGRFVLKLIDLPEKKVGELIARANDPEKATVVIKLGYMDGKIGTVMEGVYTKLTKKVEGDSLVTTLTGEESGRYTLLNKSFQQSIPGKTSFQDALTKLLEKAFPASGAPSAPDVLATIGSLLGDDAPSKESINKVPDVQAVDQSVEDVSLKGKTLLDTVSSLAGQVRAELLISDKKIHIGRPIVDTSYKPDAFDRDVSLGRLDGILENLPADEDLNLLETSKPHQAIGFKFVIAGDPKLRPAQKVSADVKGYKDGDFRILYLKHSLTLGGGYICEGVAGKDCPSENCRRQLEALCPHTPDRIVQGIAQRAKEERRQNPTVEVGTLKEYNPGTAGAAPHRGTFFFGQRFSGEETQPSIRAEVEAEEKQLLRNKPVVSPFAWHKCGLVVPVYPGMKALLSHNLNLPDDALVTGFLWSEKPAIEPPQSKEGDWWLCLPIDFDSSKPPKDDTKAVNDLITNDGKRVIEVTGLKITVGKDKLGNVGTRPDCGDEDVFLIEHKKASISIASDGGIEIVADSQSSKGKITVSSQGDIEMTSGAVKLKVGQSAVEIT